MSEPLIQIVDEHDNPLRGGTMDEAQLNGLWHRIVRVMFRDAETDRWLLQKVPPNPYYNGGLWNTTASGHVDVGEGSMEAALRELSEEMGVTTETLLEIDRYKTEVEREGKIYRRHNVTYIGEADVSGLVITPNPHEVQEILWRTSAELRAMRTDEGPTVTDGLARFIDTYLKNVQS